MKETLKKMLYLGVGAISVTAEKIEEMVDDLIQKGEATQSEKAKLIEEFVEKFKEQEKAFSSKVKNIVTKSRQDLGLPTRKEYEDLQNRIKELEKKLSDQGKA